MQDYTTQIISKVIQSLDSGVIVIDSSGTIIIVNPSARKHLRVTEDNLTTGKNIFEIDALRFFKEIYSELMKTEIVSRREITIEDNDNTFIIGLTASLIKENNTIQGAVFLFTDLTEIKKLQHEADLNRQLAQIGELTAGIVHEFRNPLSVILGMAELLLEKVSDKPDLAQKVQIIISESNHLNLLVSQFLSFAKPQEINIQKNLTDYIVQRALLLCDYLIKKYNVEIAISEIPEDLHFIYADAEKIAQALSNIIRNGIEAQIECEKRIIKISFRKMDDFIIFKVEDNGPGLPKDLQKSELLKPFVSRKKGGTGLGLSIVQRIISLHRGFINYGNNYPKGAFFEIGIPIKPLNNSLKEI